MQRALFRLAELIVPVSPLLLLTLGARHWLVGLIVLLFALLYVGMFFLLRPRNLLLRDQLIYLLSYPLVVTIAYQVWALSKRYTQSLDEGFWLLREGWFTVEGALGAYLSLLAVALVPFGLFLLLQQAKAKLAEHRSADRSVSQRWALPPCC